MHLIDFIKNNKEWKSRLTKPPYNIRISNEGNLYLFKYMTGNSFLTQEAIEARGCIVRIEGNNVRYVCRPFDKFFNYGEGKAAELDWNTAVCTEKIDGSLIKLYYDGERWRVATNGTIDAFKTDFGVLFERVLGCSYEVLCEGLDKSLTYMFELTTPETRVVIDYDDGLYFLAARNNETGEYVHIPNKTFIGYNVRIPKKYNLKNQTDTIKEVYGMSDEHEGIVVCDGNGNRVKFKSPAYLEIASITDMQKPSWDRFIELYQNETLDDYLAYNNKYAGEIAKYAETLNALKVRLETVKNDCFSVCSTRAEAAKWLIQKPESGYVFKCYTEPDLSPEEFLKNASKSYIKRLLEV